MKYNVIVTRRYRQVMAFDQYASLEIEAQTPEQAKRIVSAMKSFEIENEVDEWEDEMTSAEIIDGEGISPVEVCDCEIPSEAQP